jgi:hypothetical protein
MVDTGECYIGLQPIANIPVLVRWQFESLIGRILTKLIFVSFVFVQVYDTVSTDSKP